MFVGAASVGSVGCLCPVEEAGSASGAAGGAQWACLVSQVDGMSTLIPCGTRLSKVRATMLRCGAVMRRCSDLAANVFVFCILQDTVSSTVAANNEATSLLQRVLRTALV